MQLITQTSSSYQHEPVVQTQNKKCLISISNQIDDQLTSVNQPPV